MCFTAEVSVNLQMRRVVVITGANTGVGLQTALGLARKPHSYHVVLACRSETKAQGAVEWIREQCADASASVVPLDLADLTSVVRCAERLEAEYAGGIHAVVCNAGVGGVDRPPEPTADGGDFVYRTNFVGHFVLVLRLLPLLERAAAASRVASRVVCVSSVMHRWGHTRWTEPLSFQPRASSYNVSKLALAVFASELTRREAVRGVIGLAVNPGAVNSDIWYRGDASWGRRPAWQRTLLEIAFRSAFLTTAQGAATSISAVTEAAWERPPSDGAGALYLAPYRTPAAMPMPFELHGPFAGARPCTPHPAVGDASEGRSLWEGLVADARIRPLLGAAPALRLAPNEVI